MVTVKDPEEKIATLIYDQAGNVTSITTPGNRTTFYAYDGNYNTVGITDPMGYLYTYAYDQDDRLVGSRDPLGQTTAYLYDKANRVTAYTDQMNLTKSYAYDAHGNAISVTATDGRITRYAYDKKDRLTSVTDPMGSVAYYTYDEMDNLTGVVNYLGQGTTYTYDIEGNLTGITDVAGRTETMGYDIAGRITSYTSNGGNTITYDYNKLNNLVEKSYTDNDGNQSAQPVVYAYNALGERVAMNDATGDTEYTYDGLGRITGVTTYRTQNEDGSTNKENGDTITYTYDEADNLSAIIYPDGTRVRYEYDLNNNLTKVIDREGKTTSYVYDAINRVTEIHRPNGISTYNTYNGRNQITELKNVCNDRGCDCGWVVSSYSYTYDDRGFIVGETAIESLAGYAYDHKHDGRHTDGRHDNLYPHGNRHNGKHDKDADFVYQIVQTDRTFTYDGAGKLLSMTEDEENYGLYTTTFEYDLMGNRTSIVKTDDAGKVVEYRNYVYNESSQVVSAEIYDGKKTTAMDYTYDGDGNLITEIGRIGTDKVETTYHYAVENRLAAVYEADNLLVAMAYDGDGNRVFQLNYNLHTDEDWKGNSGNGNGNNKDNRGSGGSSNNSSSNSSNNSGSSGDSGSNNGSSTGNNGNPGNSSESNKKGGNGKDNGNTGAKSIDGSTGTGNSTNSGSTGGNSGNGTSGNSAANGTSTGAGNATNAEGNNSQNQSGILFPIGSEVSDVEQGLIDLVKTTGREKDYELIEYLNDVNRKYAEVLVEQNINGKTDTSYVYGVARLSLDRFDGSTGYYLYDPRGSVTGVTNEDGKIYQSYRYGAYGEITFGAPQYENEYTYNGESYNPNIESQYLRARYYYVVTATFLTEDSYLGDIMEPLTLNRYLYCLASPLNYRDPSGHWVTLAQERELRESINKGVGVVNMLRSTGLNDDQIFAQASLILSAMNELRLPQASVHYVLSNDIRERRFSEMINTAMARRRTMECGNILLANAIYVIGEYLAGNMNNFYTERALIDLCRLGTLYNGARIHPNDLIQLSADIYTSRNYQRYDELIIGWVIYCNHVYNMQMGKDVIDTIKAMMYKESKMGYVNGSKNDNANRDVMQSLDIRNPNIYQFIKIDPNNITVIGYDMEYSISAAKLYYDNNNREITLGLTGTNEELQVLWSLFNTQTDGRGVGYDGNYNSDTEYYLQYDNVTPMLSIGIAIITFVGHLQNANTLDGAVKAYNGGGDSSYVTDVIKIRTGDYTNLEAEIN